MKKLILTLPSKRNRYLFRKAVKEAALPLFLAFAAFFSIAMALGTHELNKLKPPFIIGAFFYPLMLILYALNLSANRKDK